MTVDGQNLRKKRWCLGSKFIIPDWDNPSEPYLTRWRVLQTPWFGIYLHRIHRDDAGRPLHDHPWSFGTLILRGGYREVYQADFQDQRVSRRWGLWSWHRMDNRAFHSIIHVKPNTWTLVVAGPRDGSQWSRYYLQNSLCPDERCTWGFLLHGENGREWHPWYEVVGAV